jgi:hypothetical protein
LRARGYSLFYLFNEKIDIYYHAAAHPYPSAYVPPGYVWFLTPFWFFENNVTEKCADIVAAKPGIFGCNVVAV